MLGALAFVAGRRWAGVGLALVVELSVLGALTYARPAEVVGIPAAVVAAIAGTVAVVFGPWEGVFVAGAGAIVFAAGDGWKPGELAAIGVWPAIVAAAGLFARRVAEQRGMLRVMLAGHERERQRLALELHDDTAQVLAAALMSLQHAERATTPEDAERANLAVRELLGETIRSVRALAVELRPKALDDFGLAAAVERLCADFEKRAGIDVELDGDAGFGRPSLEVELALYRSVQEALANIERHAAASRVRVSLNRIPAGVRVTVEDDGSGFDTGEPRRDGIGLSSLRNRAHLLGGRVAIQSIPGTGTRLTVEIPT
jgi:signal transduction histidine kinase